MKNIINNNKPLILSCLTAVLLSACGSGSGSVGNGGNPNPVAPTVKEIKISKSLVMPTADSASGGYLLRVDNNTGESVTLDSFKLSDSKDQGIVNKVIDKGSRLFGGVGYDSRLGTCSGSSIPAGGYCTLSFTPNQASGSLGVTLNFKSSKADKPKAYRAARLIEYNENVSRVGVENGATKGGFIVSNTKTLHFATPNNYSLSIPFVADEDFASIKVDSAITPLLNSNNCLNNVAAGARCDVVMRMPAGNYDNVITVTGVTANGATRSFKVNLSATTTDEADFEITKGPIVVGKPDGTAETKQLLLVNAGSTNVKFGEANLSTVISDDNGAGLSVDPKTDGTLPGDSVSTVDLTNTGVGNGDVSYSLDYSASNGSGTVGTTIYYHGTPGGGGDVATGVFTLKTAGLDFTDTAVGGEAHGTVIITNTGTDTLGNFTPILDTVAGMSIDTAYSNCNADLAPNKSCNISISYTPAAEVEASIAKLNVTAKDVTTPKAKVSPHYVGINYSAKSAQGTYTVFFDKATLAMEIQADGRDTSNMSDVLHVQGGVTDHDFVIKDVHIAGGSYSTGLSKAIQFQSLTGPSVVKTINLANDGSYHDDAGITLKANENYKVTYNYGPLTTAETGTVNQSISGTFADKPGHPYDGNIEIDYNSTNEGKVDVNGPTVKPGTGPEIVDGGKFELVKTNIARIVYSYTMPATLPAGTNSIDSFIVNDSSLPLGVLPDPTSSCRMNSNGENGRTPKTVTVGTKCEAAYFLMDQQLAGSLFYYHTTLSPIQLHQPGYTITYTTDGAPLHRVVPDGKNDFTVTAQPFTSIVATPDHTPGSQEYAVTFKLSGNDPENLLGGAAVTVSLITHNLPENVSIDGDENTTFSLANGTDSKTIKFLVPDGTPAFSVPYTFASAKDAEYNVSQGSAQVN